MALYAGSKKIAGNYSGPLKKILWENTNPTEEFVEKSITLSERADNYDYVEIVSSTGLSEQFVTQRCEIGHKTSLTATNAWHLNANSFAFRIMSRYTNNVIQGNTIEFNECVTLAYENNLNPVISMTNNRIIPLKIIGYKEV